MLNFCIKSLILAIPFIWYQKKFPGGGGWWKVTLVLVCVTDTKWTQSLTILECKLFQDVHAHTHGYKIGVRICTFQMQTCIQTCYLMYFLLPANTDRLMKIDLIFVDFKNVCYSYSFSMWTLHRSRYFLFLLGKREGLKNRNQLQA